MSNGPDQLRVFLAETDAPCPNCGYNLRGLSSGVGPECNQPLVLRVGLDEPRLGALMGAASGFLAGGGAGFLCLALVAFLSCGPPPRNDVFAVFVLPAVCMVVEDGVFSASRGRARFRGLGRVGRVVMIAAGWLLTAVPAILFTITFNA